MKNKLIVGGATALALVGGAWGVAQTASADEESTPTPSASAEAQPGNGWGRGGQDGFRGHMRGHGAMRGGADLGSLAEKLGVAEDDIEDAMEAVRDELRSTMQEGGPFGMSDEDRQSHQDAMADALATELGIDVDTVKAALQEMHDERQAARDAETDEVLDQAVEDGKLTQSEADAVRKAVEEGIVGVRGGR
ncbi:phage protease [Tessaracoccus oleiagri]|uniref:Mu-like prophage I protein n=1 Tax=Tessaracoccus oleiagri TaxID=686624 RepID=A0A1G9LPF6_9ACTN|nr:phage protease [Tessaracoccus oleiagri]SDL63724.1 Mu-like prophage I protein [Tessaracoccus oleiagri]